MMDKNIKDIIKDLAPDNTSLLSKICEVISVNVEDKTCVLKPLDGSAEISHVFLTADENSSVFFEPTVKSLVCVVFITKTSGVVVSWSQLKQFNIKIQDSELLINSNGFMISRSGQTLKAVLNEFIDNVKNAMVLTSMGPAPMAEPSKLLFEETKTKLNNILS